MKMKKFLALLLSIAMVIALVSCSMPKKAEKNKYNLAKSAQVTEETVNDFDFSADAQKYTEYIGTHFKNRNIVDEGENTENTHDETKKWIEAQLNKAGFQKGRVSEEVTVPDYYEDRFTVKDAKSGMAAPTNIVAEIPGKNPTRQIIVGAHYDGDGIGDNGTGFALLLAEAVNLVDAQPNYSVRFVFFDAEEIGGFGAEHYARLIRNRGEAENTLFMVNLDSLGFGDYCNIYGGVAKDNRVEETGAYDFAMAKAEAIGLKTMGTEELDGYYAKNGKGPKIEEKTIYTNPWTFKNPAPKNADYPSPSTGDWSDHVGFKKLGIPYLYMEATNWYAKGDNGEDAYTGYFDTGRANLAEHGMFMNTKYDTLKNINKYFPGRTLQHFQVFSPLLSAVIVDAQAV